MLKSVKSCTISACGNFAFLGTEAGWIERFNLQSGLSRGSYVDNSEARSCAHNGEVVGVACDAINCVMISVGYYGDIKVSDKAPFSYLVYFDKLFEIIESFCISS